MDVHDESSDTRVPAPSGDLDDPSLLVGRVFGARGEFWALEVLEPTGSNGELLGYAISMPWLPLLHVESLDAETGEVALRMAWTDRGDEHEGPGQRPCSETLALPTAMLEDDVLRVGPMDLEVATSAGRANVYDFYLTGSPGADATTLRNLEFGGLFDLRDLEQDLASTADTFCRESSLECKPCPDEAPVCVTLHLRAEVAYDHGPEPRDLACASELAEPALYSYGSERIITRSLDDPNVLRGLDFEGVEVWHRDDWSTGSAAASVKMYLVPAERADRLDPPRTQEVLLVLETQDATRWVEHHLDPATGAALHEQLHTDGSAANAIAELLASALGWWLGLGCSTGPVPTGGAAPLFSVALILASRRRLWRSPRR